MQRSLAIVCITLFAVSQYARQLSYLQCRLVNNFSTTTRHCDCEKQTNDVQPNSKEFPVTKTAIHPNVDEFYAQVKTSSSFGYIPFTSIILFIPYTAAASEGNYGKLYKPPRCRFFLLITA